MGDPPALPGRQSKFDISGGRPRLSIGETPEREPPKQSRGSKVTAVPPTYAASQVVGLVQRKSAIDLRRAYGASSRNFGGGRRWARRYFVLATGPDEEVITDCVRNQEQ